MINVHGIRRNVKNVVRNYSDAQIKVREATSNDPWGPSSTIMSEIADLTYNVVAFSEIMQMIWKRLNDHGKNWRHVYKALVLLEYLIKTGSEKVAQQCKENIFAIQTLKDFQYIEENKDQGMNVREKSKQLVSLLKDDERLKNERTRALKARERFAQATSHVGNDGLSKVGTTARRDSFSSSSNGAASPRELESARPQTAGEEELQLQLALAMSKEEAEQEERLRRNDDLRLQMAITESQEDFRRAHDKTPGQSSDEGGHLDDLMEMNFNLHGMVSPPQPNATDPWGIPLASNIPKVTDPWGSPLSTQPTNNNDTWNTPSSPPTMNPQTGVTNASASDPWGGAQTPLDHSNDPWSPRSATASSPSFDAFGTLHGAAAAAANGEIDEFDMLRSRGTTSPGDSGRSTTSPNPFDMSGVKDTLANEKQQKHARKTPESFLGANSNLVNLDALVTSQPGTVVLPPGGTNPFAATPLSNPFQATKPPPPTINQLRAQSQFSAFSGAPLPEPHVVIPLPASMVPTGGAPNQTVTSPQGSNPFLH